MRRRRLAKLVQSAALIAVLVAAQATALFHTDLEDAHPAGDICALCVGLTGLGAGNVAAASHVDFGVASVELTDYLLVHAVPRHVVRAFARGPPQAS